MRRVRLAEELVRGHEADDTPVGDHSPLRKMLGYGAKILFIGCSTNHNTLMHGAEEIADPLYWIDRENTVEYILDDGDGHLIKRPSYRHSFVADGRKLSQRYGRLEGLLGEGEIIKGKLLAADTTVMDANAAWLRGIEKLREDPWYFVEFKE